MSDTQRRLAAILAADVAGYSRLMGEDEAGTVAALDRCRGVFRQHIEGGGGRVVDMAGDSVLAVFASVVEAVACADAVQQALADESMRFRIGVHIGDVIEKADGTIYGDGVNIAARLEGLAEPGGIMASASAFEQIEGKLDLGFEDAGEHEVKNITRPVRAYRLAGDAPVPEPPSLPSKPSIAVLAFDNMSGDAEQEFFADGIAEDLITALSRLRWLFVVARNSTFTYKGGAVDVKQVARQLGVRYIVEGSVRRGGNRVRISVQLIDGTTGNHVWAERYDRMLDDIFALQDEITETITAAIAPELETIERDRARHRPPDNLDAWEAYQRGMWHLYRFTPEDNVAAQALFQNAIGRDDDFAPAHAALAYTHYLAHLLDYPDADLAEGFAEARRAVALDGRDAFGHFALGRVYMAREELDRAVEELQDAVSCDPNLAIAHFALAYSQAIMGQAHDARSEIELASRLSPRDPGTWAFDVVRADVDALLGDHAGALQWLRRAIGRPNAEHPAYWRLAATLAQCGYLDEARIVFAELRKARPNLTWQILARQFIGMAEAGLFRWYREGLIKAGMPE